MSSFAFARSRKKAPQQAEQSSDGAKADGGSPGLLRLKKDIQDLDCPSTMAISFPGNDISKFQVVFVPIEGMWKGGRFVFRFEVPIDDPIEDYPYKPPTCICTTPVFHPNINSEGKICLSILREDWRPFYTITSVLQSLQLLFTELVNPDDPLNKEAAHLMKTDHDQFALTVRRTVAGGVTVNGITYRGNRNR